MTTEEIAEKRNEVAPVCGQCGDVNDAADFGSICGDCRRLDEVIAVYEAQGWKVRWLRKAWQCDGEPYIEIEEGILPPEAGHEQAVAAIKRGKTEEFLCEDCLHANAEGWLE